jgi:hypothetical protein
VPHEIEKVSQLVPSASVPERRLLIVPELEQFATDGVVVWTPELVDLLLNWSDFKIPGHGIYRMALVSRKLTTGQVYDRDKDICITDPLTKWNSSLPEEQQLDMSIVYANTASTHPGVGNGSGNYGRIEFFTREHFDRQRERYPKSPPQSSFSSSWSKILDCSLRDQHVDLRGHHCTQDYRSEGWLPNWLMQGNVHVSEPYRHIVTLERSPAGEIMPRCFAL